MSVQEFEQKLEARDPSLFDGILSQNTTGDRRSLLLLQKIIRKRFAGYNYLEIGSFRGGSLQPLVQDPLCKRIYSIDPRPARVWDDRGWNEPYSENSTEGMLSNLGKISSRAREVITSFECTASQVPIGEIRELPHLMFIDGAHIEKCVLEDWDFCSRLNPDAVIYFHDSQIIFTALHVICEKLRESGKEFICYNLPDHVFVIERAKPYLADDPEFHAEIRNNGVGYLAGMEHNRFYREFYTEKSTTFFRNVRDKILRIPSAIRRRLKRAAL